MKKKLKRLMSLGLALCLCVAMLPAASAAGSGDMTISTVANERSDGTYDVVYTATLTMSDTYAERAAAAGISNLGDFLFTCILKDGFVEQLTSPSQDQFTFSGPGSSNFTFVSVSKSGSDELSIVYKLNTAHFSGMDAAEIKAELTKSMTMTSDTMNVTAAQLTTAKKGGASIQTNASVEISSDGFGIDETADTASATMSINPYSSGSSGGSGGGGGGAGGGGGGAVDTKHEIEVDNSSDKGYAEPHVSEAKTGEKVTINVDDIDKGHRVVQIIITTEDGSKITVDRKDAVTYEFVMPNGPVTIEPVYDLSATRPEESGVNDTLTADDHIAFMVGDDKGNFRPNANITRAEVAQIFYALLKDKNIPITNSFTDVDPDAWYATAVHTMASLGAVKGVGNGQFAPERPITRAEFATIASNFAKFARDQFDFIDVDETHWAYPYISASSYYGWVAGVGGNKFEPDRPIMRAEAATIVNNMLGRIGDEVKIDAGHGRQFPDVDESHWGWYEIGEATDSHDHSFDGEFIEETWHD